MWQGWVDLISGIWVLSCGFFNPLQAADNMWIPGIIVFIFGIWSAKKGKSWQGFVNSLAGLWLFLSGAFFGLNTGWNFIIFGAIITIIALWNVSVHPNNSALLRA